MPLDPALKGGAYEALSGQVIRVRLWSYCPAKMGAKRDMDDHLSGADEKGGRCSRLSRRKFLKLTAMAGLSVGAIGVHKQSDSAPSVQPVDASAAKGRWISTSCLNCPARCGITV